MLQIFGFFNHYEKHRGWWFAETSHHHNHKNRNIVNPYLLIIFFHSRHPVFVKSSHCSNIIGTYLSHLVVTWKHEWRPLGNNKEKSLGTTQNNFEPLGKCMDNTRAHLKLGNHLGQLGNCLNYTWGQLWYFGITWLLLCDICPVGGI